VPRFEIPTLDVVKRFILENKNLHLKIATQTPLLKFNYAMAHNLGIKLSNGNIVTFIDAAGAHARWTESICCTVIYLKYI
jgi:hypothetical protein